MNPSLPFLGKVNNPLNRWNSYGDLRGIDGPGPLTLISNIFQLIALIAGLYAMLNMILAGFRYISSNGDKNAIDTAKKQMYNSLIGMLIIVMSYTIAAIIGQLLFGSAGFLFNPQIFGPKQ
jgi:hypothetical protein